MWFIEIRKRVFLLRHFEHLLIQEYIQLTTKINVLFRSLGVEHSFVLSCKLDNWSHDQVSHMEKCGNVKVNTELEYCVPKTIEVPCLSYTDRDTREKYIHAKYVTQLFKRANGKTSRPPGRVVRKISPQGSPTSISRSRSNTAMVEYIGIVHVHVVECRDLIIKDILSSDPYCVLRLGTQVNKTKTKYKTLAPKYGENFTFSWDGCDSLIVELFDKDDLTKDDHMGRLQLDLSPLLQKEGEVMRGWHLIRHRKKSDKLQGEILLEVSFMAIK